MPTLRKLDLELQNLTLMPTIFHGVGDGLD